MNSQYKPLKGNNESKFLLMKIVLLFIAYTFWILFTEAFTEESTGLCSPVDFGFSVLFYIKIFLKFNNKDISKKISNLSANFENFQQTTFAFSSTLSGSAYILAKNGQTYTKSRSIIWDVQLTYINNLHISFKSFF